MSEKKKSPGFWFFTGDWLKDTELRFCSIFARGLLVDLLCLMFESNERGYLSTPSGTPRSNESIVDAVSGGDRNEKLSALRELEESGVLSRDNRGVLYSRRLAKLGELSEARKQAGSKGGSNKQANGEAKPKQSGSKQGSKTEANDQQNSKQNRGVSVSDSVSVSDTDTASVSDSVSVSEKLIGIDKKSTPSSPKQTSVQRKPPSADEVRRYMADQGYDDDADAFVDFYAANGWVQGRGKPIKDWKAAVRNWQRSGFRKSTGASTPVTFAQQRVENSKKAIEEFVNGN